MLCLLCFGTFRVPGLPVVGRIRSESRPCMTTESTSDIAKETRCESWDQMVFARINTTASRVPICVLQALTVELLSTESRGQAKINPSFPSDIHDIVG